MNKKKFVILLLAMFGTAWIIYCSYMANWPIINIAFMLTAELFGMLYGIAFFKASQLDSSH